MQLSLCRVGVAGPCHTRLLTSPAFRPCCCALALSGLGKAVASESSALNSGLLRRPFAPCVTWRTVSPPTALHPWLCSRGCTFHLNSIRMFKFSSMAPKACLPSPQRLAFGSVPTAYTLADPDESGCSTHSRQTLGTMETPLHYRWLN